MYLSEPKLLDIVKKQYRFKLNALSTTFMVFMFLQIGALFLSFVNNKYEMGHDPSYQFTLSHLTNDLNFGLAVIWSFVLGIMLLTRNRTNEAFSFVTTRFSNHLANFLFMASASLFAGLIVILTGPTLKLMGYLFYGDLIVNTPSIAESPVDFLLRLVTAIAYLLLWFMFGYTISAFVQVSKWVIVGIFILFLIFSSSIESWNGAQYVVYLVDFIVAEKSVFLFLLKMTSIIIGLFAFSAYLTNRLEVKN